ncbi:MAG: histidine kinase, partial [Gammaproteobacteria bacterium]
LNLTTTPADKIIADALDQVAGQVHQTAAEISVQPNMPPVYGSPERLAQLYQNLIDNALKFAGADTTPLIQVGWDQEKEFFFVEDNGPGIAPHYHSRIFGLFDQIDAKQDGSGIGLATAKRIVESHGGEMWVDSSSSLGGAKFCFTLCDYQPALPGLEQAHAEHG